MMLLFDEYLFHRLLLVRVKIIFIIFVSVTPLLDLTWLDLIHPCTSTWTYWATLRRHSCLLRAATSASSQVNPIPRRSFLTIPLQFVLGRLGPLLKPGTSQYSAWCVLRRWQLTLPEWWQLMTKQHETKMKQKRLLSYSGWLEHFSMKVIYLKPLRPNCSFITRQQSTLTYQWNIRHSGVTKVGVTQCGNWSCRLFYLEKVMTFF